MSDKDHTINRDRDAPTDDQQDAGKRTFICEYCGRKFTDRARYERHVDREKREQLKGHAIGEAILGHDEELRGR